MLGLGLGLNRFNLAALPTQRYFSTFDPVLNSYGELDTAFTPSGDFEVEAQVSTVSESIVSIFSGTNQNEDGIGLRMNADGSLFAFVFVGSTLQTTITSSTGFNDGILHTIKLAYTGTTAELFVDGVSEGSATWSLNDNQHIKNIGYRPTSLQYFDGIIANVKLTDLATPANSRIFPVGLSGGASVENSTINSGSITYYNLPSSNQERFTFDEANQRWVGDELVTNGMFDADSDWTKGAGWTIADSKLQSDGTSSRTSQAGSEYNNLYDFVVTFNILDHVGGGTLSVELGSFSGTPVPGLGNGGFSMDLTSPGTNTNFAFYSTGFIGSIDNVSVKRLLEIA